MDYGCATIVFGLGEAIALIVFPVLNKMIGPASDSFFDIPSILKGVLERLVMLTSLLHGIPQVIIAFSAMKLGTRLHDEGPTQISNTYYLVGNLLSILFAIIMSIVATNLCS